ncbi:hypothetical protein COO60DRAFT_1461447 [Scenedesmus sp. NREL 46B-D3]|nr:hypothetical protein COO60DRAFT_1461447 [Scenedesmus sp. NREL 46B-D3]
MALSSMQCASRQSTMRGTDRTPVCGVRYLVRHAPRLGGLAQSAEGRSSGARLAPVNAFNPARKDQDDKNQKQRLMLGFRVPRNKAEEAESVMTFVALVGFFLTGMFFIVPEMHIFAPALYRAMTGQ